MACNSKTAGHKANRTLGLGVVVTCISGIFDLLVLKVIWSHSVHFFQNGLYLENVGYKAKRSELWDSGVVVICTFGIVDLLAFKVSLGSFGARVSKMASISKRAGCKVQQTEI